ncbi:MAG: TetR/AcrR family transcriptional regulator [Candidatus Gracilibacteria bacterium]|nr:TetR/AcrR family transcriptional regulator [Candidatus Gracilibacteria bacterium]
MVVPKKLNKFLNFIREQEGIPEEELKTSKYLQIIAAAIPLFNKFGYKKVSVDKIVAKAGVAKGTFYLYFKNKDELYMKIIDYVFTKGQIGVTKMNKNEKDLKKRCYRNLMGGLVFIQKSSLVKGIMCGGKDYFSESVNREYLEKRHRELLLTLVYGENFDEENIDIELVFNFSMMTHFFFSILEIKKEYETEFEEFEIQTSQDEQIRDIVLKETGKENIEDITGEEFFYTSASKFAKAITIGLFSEEFKEKKFADYKFFIEKVEGI